MSQPNRPTHDILASLGEYTDRQTGEIKKRRLKIGVVFTNSEGHQFGKLDSVPVGWDGSFAIFPVRDRE